MKARVRGQLLVGVVLVAGLGLGAAGGVAADRSLSNRAATELIAPASDAPLRVEVFSHRFGRTIPLSIRAVSSSNLVESQLKTGIVTHVARHAPGHSWQTGQEILAIDGIPSYIVVTEAVFYRPIERAISGPDVEAAQEALVALGFLEQRDVNGTAGQATIAAVRDFNLSAGHGRSAVLALGALVAVPRSDARLETQLVKGAQAPRSLAFSTSDHIQLVGLTSASPNVRVGQTVTVDGIDETGFTVASISDSGIDAELSLSPSDPSWSCESLCRGVEPGHQVILRGELVLVAETEGPAVPLSALSTDATGRTSVQVAAGEPVPVEVLLVDEGLALVDGVQVGDVIVVDSSP